MIKIDFQLGYIYQLNGVVVIGVCSFVTVGGRTQGSDNNLFGDLIDKWVRDEPNGNDIMMEFVSIIRQRFCCWYSCWCCSSDMAKRWGYLWALDWRAFDYLETPSDYFVVQIISRPTCSVFIFWQFSWNYSWGLNWINTKIFANKHG